MLQAQSDTARWELRAIDKHYEAGWLWRVFFGTDYRDLWTTPTKMPTLNLQTFAGGLTPIKQGGGQQTKSLRVANPDGIEFSFRSVDKDPSAALPPDLVGTFADDLVQDQISSSDPAGPVVVAPLLAAAGVIHATPQLFVMPDDPALGQFRPTFANMIGLIEEHPQEGKTRIPGLEGASKIIGMDKLLERLANHPAEHIDTVAFLKARLMDVFMGDWDRHRGQWNWARVGPDNSSTPWVPDPEDRDQAFVRYDGVLLAIARRTLPQLVNFGPGYPGIRGATFNGRELDRQLLDGLDRPTWDSVAHDLQQRLSDAVIDSAVLQLPVQQYRLDGARLARSLKARRNGLPRMATEYYRYLARDTDLHGTDMPDRVTIIRGGTQGEVEVRMEGKDTVDGQPALIRQAHRLFRSPDTHEIRVYLHGGDDSVYVNGNGSGKIKVRIIGGKGEDAVVDSSTAGGLQIYDSGEHTSVSAVHGYRMERKPYTVPDTTEPVPPTDYGGFINPTVWGSFGADLGLFIGGGITVTHFGFRKDPYGSYQVIRAGYATTPKTFRAEYRGEWRRENSRTRTNLFLRASGIEILRFYGFGNETPGGNNNFFKVQQEQFLIEPSLTLPLASRITFTLGPRAQFSHLNKNTGRFIRTLPGLYGTDEFGEIGARGALRIDTRDLPAAPRHGMLLDLQGIVYPAIWDVKSTFGKVAGDFSTYLSASIPLKPTIALRVGGEKIFGTFPFHEAAYIGGRATVRGWQEQRFAGDASAYGNAELRLHLGRTKLLVPTDVGVFGLADVGRVYLKGETSDVWHTGFGGGVSLGILDPSSTVTITVANSEERTAAYIRAGFLF